MKTILIVEDDNSIADVLKIILEGEGFRVVIDPTGDSVIDGLNDHIDLGLIDYLLPGKSGIDVIEALKKHVSYSSIPLILMSANTETELAQIAKNCGVSSYLPKPFDIADLISKVKSLL